MEEELNLAEYFKIIKKRKKMIIAITLLFVLLATAYSFIKPKTYESIVMIEIGKIDDKTVIHPKELKSLIISPVILNPVMTKLHQEGKNPFLKDLYATPISDKYLTIKLETYNAAEAKEIILALINELFEYTNKELNKHKNLIIEEYNESIALANEGYSKTVKKIKEEIAERENNINSFEKDIIELEEQAKSLHSSDLSKEGLAKSTLIVSILNSYESRLLNEKNKIMSLEKELIDKKLNLDKIKTNKKLELEKKLLNTKDFNIITGPNVSLKIRSIRPDLLMGLGIGLFISVLLAFILELKIFD